jgi:hypothetical protein
MTVEREWTAITLGEARKAIEWAVTVDLEVILS